MFRTTPTKAGCCTRRAQALGGTVSFGKASAWSSPVDSLSVSVICDQLGEQDSLAITD